MKKIRWRLRNTKGRNLQRKRYYDKYRRARNSHDRWKNWEERVVVFGHFPDNKLHLLLGRSIQAIQVKRSKILNHALRLGREQVITMFFKDDTKDKYRKILLNLPGEQIRRLKKSLTKEELKTFNYLNSISLDRTSAAWINSL